MKIRFNSEHLDMALTSKLETELEFKSSADKVYSIISSQNYHVANASDTVHEVEVHEGDWQTTGSVKLWKFTVGKTTSSPCS